MATNLKEIVREQGDKDSIQFPVAKAVGAVTIVAAMLSIGVMVGKTDAAAVALAVRVDKVERTEVELMRLILEMSGDMKEVKSMVHMHMGTQPNSSTK